MIYPTRYCPHPPHPKQQAFLALNCREAFFGGAAGGGKSVALLMAALQYVDGPGYAALILRRDLQRLALAGGLIPRSHEWLASTPAVWNADRRQWTFPNAAGQPATLSFGYLDSPFDKYRYASSEYQYLAFDELTEFREEDYLFLFSRLRRATALTMPLRVRSASNPGNTGHLWVKRRFIEGATPVNINQQTFFTREGRFYLPSRIADNPSLDEQEYLEVLSYLPPLERERLAHGDWNVQQAGLFQPAWLRYYVAASDQAELLDPTGRVVASVPDYYCRRFATVDPAGTSADVAQEARGRTASYSVVQVWDQPRPHALAHFLLLRHQVRERVAFDGLLSILRDVHAVWRPEQLWIENEKLGAAAVSILEKEGLPLRTVATRGKDKVSRAAWLTHKFSRGEVFLPKYETGWRHAFEAELLAWTGRDHEPSDQIDAAAYAAQLASQTDHRPLRILPAATRS